MGLRFRKSIRIAPGIRLNFGKRSTSLSCGPRGAKLNISRRGVKTTVGLPGTGLSYSSLTPAGSGGDSAVGFCILLVIIAIVAVFVNLS
ncbi:MAG TPA: DUF4236 domain-containing protein [Lacipirellulaceae bacterium]|nr:DUF4236 domain-containing protein [Lacipirellulaceae bacterium]